jgi:hypothetical protein
VGALLIGGFAEIINISWALGISAVISAILGIFMLLQMSFVRKLA